MDIIRRKINYLSTIAEIEIKNYIYNSKYKQYFKKIRAPQNFNTMLKYINNLKKEKGVDQFLVDKLRLMACKEFSQHLVFAAENNFYCLPCEESLNSSLKCLHYNIVNHLPQKRILISLSYAISKHNDYNEDYDSCICKDGDPNNQWWGDEESFEQWCSHEE